MYKKLINLILKLFKQKVRRRNRNKNNSVARWKYLSNDKDTLEYVLAFSDYACALTSYVMTKKIGPDVYVLRERFLQAKKRLDLTSGELFLTSDIQPLYFDFVDGKLYGDKNVIERESMKWIDDFFGAVLEKRLDDGIAVKYELAVYFIYLIHLSNAGYATIYPEFY